MSEGRLSIMRVESAGCLSAHCLVVCCEHDIFLQAGITEAAALLLDDQCPCVLLLSCPPPFLPPSFLLVSLQLQNPINTISPSQTIIILIERCVSHKNFLCIDPAEPIHCVCGWCVLCPGCFASATVLTDDRGLKTHNKQTKQTPSCGLKQDFP